jgi:hypothetical protein
MDPSGTYENEISYDNLVSMILLSDLNLPNACSRSMLRYCSGWHWN